MKSSHSRVLDAPKAIIHDDPEAVSTENWENPDMVGSAASTTLIRQLGDMKASLFWLLFGLICLLFIAVTIGGAVGCSRAAGKNYHMETVTRSLSPM